MTELGDKSPGLRTSWEIPAVAQETLRDKRQCKESHCPDGSPSLPSPLALAESLSSSLLSFLSTEGGIISLTLEEH